MMLKTLGLLVAVLSLARCDSILFTRDGLSKLQTRIIENDGLLIWLSIGNETKLSGHIGGGRNLSLLYCSDVSCLYSETNSVLSIIALNSTFQVEWNLINRTGSFSDCFNLNSTTLSWYGGPEVKLTEWPIEKLTFNNRPYISSKLDNGAVIEAYWLNSKGGFILVDKIVPLFVDQNNKVKDAVCFRAASELPYQNRQVILKYLLAARNNSRDAHLYAINKHMGKPQDLPNEKMVIEPIWTTWGRYKASIDDSIVIDFLKDIYNHNFTKGQIEIDDKWEECYGNATFYDKKFGQIKETIETIHNYGFRATLWVHPFVNDECSTPKAEGLKHNYFVTSSSTGNPYTAWWNGDKALIIDYTNKNASNWFKQRLLSLSDKYGIDGFKCDAGENDWLPNEPTFHKNYSDAPNAYTKLYVDACAELGNLVEVRSGYRSQNLSIFVRMLDKDSVWGNNNGLTSLVHSLLQFNMIGYTYVLPDLVGGNAYNGLPSAELLVRWTQANTFMPSLQFSILPWDLGKTDNFDATEIIRNMTVLHERYSDIIIDAMRNSSQRGEPVNPPIWWIDTSDEIALRTDDEFLLGQKILVAPVLKEGARYRDVYLPKGRWADGNSGRIYAGRSTLKNYPAPINLLPYFIRL